MRRSTLIALMLPLLLASGCAGSRPLVGTWELVPAEPSQQTAPTRKLLTPTHFAFGERTSNGVWAGGGTWLLHGNTYTEIIDYHSIPILVGHTLQFECRLEGDMWYHTGDFEVHGRKFHIEEVWRRVE